MVTKLVIAGHGKNKDGSFDPGATPAFMKQGEHRYYVDTFFPRVRKYLPDGHDVVLFSEYNVYSHSNLNALAKSYGNDTQVIEMHFDALDSAQSATGGHVIVHADYSPDELDLRLRDWIKKFVGVRYTHKGHTGISGRSDLRNCNIAKQNNVNYRLVELGFGSNKKDAEVMMSRVDALAKDFVMAICGKVKEPKPVNPPVAGQQHTVKSGDTLWGIATANRMTVNQLMKLNPGIKTTIFPGQKINIGIVKTYTVKSGDSLSAIGARLGVKWQDIAKLNNIKSPYVIQPGQKLKY